MTNQETNKWNDWHFQICLALISRPAFDPYGSVRSVNFGDIINKADRMISLLQEREAQQSHENENFVSKTAK